MLGNCVSIRVGFAAVLLLLCSAGRAAEVSWIGGAACPAHWSIQPAAPSEGDIVRFSGPAGFYLNGALAEREFGGKPSIRFDSVEHRIELQFQPPASVVEEGFWSPVCGLQGTFGPLEAGPWEFFCERRGVAFSIFFEVSATASVQTVLHVDANATGAGNGLTWADALVDLQTALALATEGTEVRVAKGVYVPHDVGPFDDGGMIDDPDPGAAFYLKSGVVLKGGYAGSSGPNPNERDLFDYESVLSGDLFGNDGSFAHPSEMVDGGGRSDNTYHVVVAIGTDSTAVLDGFTITGGYAFGSPVPDMLSCGGGIYSDGASPTIRNCLIAGNAVGHYGAGVYSRSRCTLTLIDCVIADNWSDWWGGGIFNDGSTVRVERCLVSGNRARYHGAGVHSHTNASSILSNCILSGNLAVDSAWGRGGALYSYLAEVRLSHCTLAGNRAAQGPSLTCDSQGQERASEIQLDNCILWDAAGGIWNNDDSRLAIESCDVWGGLDGQSNLDADPCFVEIGCWDEAGTLDDFSDDQWFEGDYRLRWESPCVDAACAMGIPDPDARDFFGRSRVSGSVADIGAHELTNDPPIANAGPNVAGFSLDGIRGNVTLDAKRSFDPEGQSLTWRWYRDSELISEDEQFTIELPLGEYRFTLIVDDGVNESEPDHILASVMQVVDVSAMVMPNRIRRLDRGGFLTTMSLAPADRGPSDFDPAEPLLFFPGGIEAVTQAVTTSLAHRTVILAKFHKADILAAVPEDGAVELRIVGRFKDGQFFSGVSTIRIE